jgi:hypothetical protein
MFTPKFRLTLAISLAVGSLAFLAVTLNAAKARQRHTTAAAPLKARILRRKDKGKDQPDATELAKLRQTAQEVEERKFEDEIPKHVPIKFKLKAQKEKKFKDLHNPNWYRDFELEVTNTSNKPIYYLDLDLVYPEIESGIGAPVIVPLRYGRMNFIDHHAVPLPTDVPILPGATHTFSIPESDRKGWEWHKINKNTPDPKKVVLQFGALSFGDGTGYDTLQAVPYPYRKNRSATANCREGPVPVVAKGGPLSDRSIDLGTSLEGQWLLKITGRSSAGYFSGGAGSYSFLIEPSVSVDTCCGSGCFFMKPSMDSCSCGSSQGNSYPACTDPEGICGTPRLGGRFCEQFGVACPEFFINVCVEGAPTPPPTPSPSPTPPTSPSPTPEPTCDPTTKPNNSNCYCNTILASAGLGPPFWDCGVGCTGATGADYIQYPGTPGYGGCPPNKYNDGRDCCRCITATCPNGQTANVNTCQCPSPTPTPTQTPVTGGGGGYEGGGGYPYCTDYFWYWFISYDGGETWEPTGQVDYAGCW